MLRRLLPFALAFPTGYAIAQSPTDASARFAPQFYQYTIDGPTRTRISELAVPLYVLVPVTSSFSIDIGGAYARARVEQTAGGTTASSTISGFTDTQVRANYVIGNDFIVLTGGLNLPNGESTVSQQQLVAASLIGSDFLALPISNMGTGFGATAGMAIARPAGTWNLGFGASVRRSAGYDPVDAGGGPVLHYQPGNEYRARVGIDRGIGTGRVTLGLTYSTFGDDNLAGSVYNTGDRYIAQLGFDNTVGTGRLAIDAWNLFRTNGTLADGSFYGHENIGNLDLAYDVPAGRLTIEPTVEGRIWTQQNASASVLATAGLRADVRVGGVTVSPSGGYSTGHIASPGGAGLSETTPMRGFHAMLAIRLR
jgi:hypothetical protein